MAPTTKKAARKEEMLLRDFAMALPGAHEDFPWGERAIKVNGKIFTTLYAHDDGTLSMSTKLPQSNGEALHGYDFTSPTHYGMGKYGWVTSTFPPKKAVPLDVMQDWILESYRAVAPKKLVKELDARGEAAAVATPKTAAKTKAKKKTARRR